MLKLMWTVRRMSLQTNVIFSWFKFYIAQFVQYIIGYRIEAMRNEEERENGL